MSDNFVDVELSSYEIDLMIKYTYPFEAVEDQLEALKGKPGNHIIKIERVYLSTLMADLIHSAKKIRKRTVLEDIDCLYEVLESEEKRKTQYLFRVTR